MMVGNFITHTLRMIYTDVIIVIIACLTFFPLGARDLY